MLIAFYKSVFLGFTHLYIHIYVYIVYIYINIYIYIYSPIHIDFLLREAHG